MHRRAERTPQTGPGSNWRKKKKKKVALPNPHTRLKKEEPKDMQKPRSTNIKERRSRSDLMGHTKKRLEGRKGRTAPRLVEKKVNNSRAEGVSLIQKKKVKG